MPCFILLSWDSTTQLFRLSFGCITFLRNLAVNLLQWRSSGNVPANNSATQLLLDIATPSACLSTLLFKVWRMHSFFPFPHGRCVESFGRKIWKESLIFVLGLHPHLSPTCLVIAWKWCWAHPFKPFPWDSTDNLESLSQLKILQLLEIMNVSRPISCKLGLPSTRLIGTSVIFSTFILSCQLVHHWKNFRKAPLARPSNWTLLSALIKRLPSSANLNFFASISENVAETKMINKRGKRIASCGTQVLVLNVSLQWSPVSMFKQRFFVNSYRSQSVCSKYRCC